MAGCFVLRALFSFLNRKTFKRKLVIVLIKKAKRFRQSFERHLQGEKGKSILVGSPILYVQKTFTRCGREEDRSRVGATSSAAILRDRA